MACRGLLHTCAPVGRTKFLRCKLSSPNTTIIVRTLTISALKSPKHSPSEQSRRTQQYLHTAIKLGQDPPLQHSPRRGLCTSGCQRDVVRLDALQRSVLSVGAAVAALTNPHRHDMVATLAETTGTSALANLHQTMLAHPEGRLILREKPRISSSTVDLEELKNLPEETLGRVYWKFLEDNQVTPDSRCEVQFVEDPELRYVMQRYREVHDLVHALLGMPTNMLGEVAVKWVESLQTGLPMCTGAAIFGPLRFKTKQRKTYVKDYLPWALKVGSTARPLMNVYFERRWDQDVTSLRDELGIEPFEPKA